MMSSEGTIDAGPGAVGVDPVVFRSIVEENIDAVYAFVARRCGSAAAETLTAEVFEEGFISWHRFNPDRGSPRQWIFGVAANVVRKHHRLERRYLRDAAAHARFSALTVESADLDTALQAAAAWPIVAAALADLRSDDRDALLLFAWAELTYSEIAGTLHVPIGTVRSRIHRARLSLRHHLHAAGIGPLEEDLP